MYILVLALLTVSWWGYRHARSEPLGVALGTLLVTKTAAPMVWPLLLAHQRCRAVMWGGGTIQLPLTVFDYQQARVVWTVASLVLLIVTLAVLMWQLNLTAFTAKCISWYSRYSRCLGGAIATREASPWG